MPLHPSCRGGCQQCRCTLSQTVRNQETSLEISPMLRQRYLLTTVSFELEYFLNEETKGVLTDTVMDFHDWHQTWLPQLKPNVRWDSPFNNVVVPSCRGGCNSAVLLPSADHVGGVLCGELPPDGRRRRAGCGRRHHQPGVSPGPPDTSTADRMTTDD